MGEVVDLEQHRRRKMRGLPRRKNRPLKTEERAQKATDSEVAPAAGDEPKKRPPEPRD